MSKVLRENLQKNETLNYLILTFLCTWLIWGIIFASSKGMISDKLYMDHTLLLIIIGGSSPSAVAFLYTGITKGFKGVKALFFKILKWKANPLWYLFALLYVPAIYYAPAFLCELLGEQYVIAPRYQFLQLITLFAGQLYVGPLNEEFGWRGFVLPRLQEHFNPLIASILLGIIHACWHIPLFFITGPYQNKAFFPYYMFIVIIYSILYTWLYNSTGGSLISVCLLHLSCNFQSNYFIVTFPENPTILYSVLSNIIVVVPLIFAIYSMLRYKHKKVTI